MEKKNGLIILFSLFLIVTLGIGIVIGRFVIPQSNNNIDLSDMEYSNLVRGEKDNYKIRIREFSNFRCGWCKKSQDVIKKVLQKYPNEVKHEFINFPNFAHKESILSAKGLLAAVRQGKGEEMREKLFNTQFVGEEGLVQIAQDLGLDINMFKNDINSKKMDTKLQDRKSVV